MSSQEPAQQILKTKLYPPRLPPIVERERLLEELEQSKTAKLTTIVAGAGYGKSTLAAEFLTKQASPFVWYQLEETDSDLAVFLNYLIAGLRSIHQSFGKKTLSQVAATENVSQQAKAILSTLIGELDELVGEELFIVLDDFQAVAEAPDITAAMAFLLDHMLPSLHFIVLSRSDLLLNLSRLRANRELIELAEHDLCFTEGEVATLYADVFGMPLAEEDLAALFQTTEGWVSGLVLFYIALKGRKNQLVDEAMKKYRLSLAGVFEYLSKAVYDNQPEEVRDFATRTCILTRMNPAFCDELLGVDNSRQILSRMVSDRLFTIPLDDEGQWYRYHHGLQAFLQSTLKDGLAGEERRKLHLKAAALWEKKGDREQALHHYMEVEDYESAARILESMAPELGTHRVFFLNRAISRLPEKALYEHKELWLFLGRTNALLGDVGALVQILGSIGNAYEETGESDSQAHALASRAVALWALGDAEAALVAISKARDMTPSGSAHYHYRCAMEATINAFADIDGADKLAELALSVLHGVTDIWYRTNMIVWSGVPLFIIGRLHDAARALLGAEKSGEQGVLVTGHAAIYAFSSWSYALVAELPEAKAIAERGIASGEEHSLIPVAFVSHAGKALSLAYSGEMELAREEASIAEMMSNQHGQGAFLWWCDILLAEAFGVLGDRSKSYMHIERFENGYGQFVQTKRLAQVAWIAVSIEEIPMERSIREINEIMKQSKGLPRSLAYSLLFRLQTQAGQEKAARATLEEYISEFGGDVVLRYMTTDASYLLPIFTGFFQKDRHTQFMERVYSLNGARSIPFLKALENSEHPDVATKAHALLETISREAAPALELHLLGRFELSQGKRTLTQSDWKSKKSLSVFKFLSAKRDSGYIPRDVLMDLLWPEVPPESAAKSLNVALSALRKTIEPEAPRGESSYLSVHGDSLRLELGQGGTIDLERFKEKLDFARRAKESGDFDLYFSTLHETCELYRGDFLSEDPYEDWCAQERESLKNEYVSINTELATEHLRRGEGTEALDHLEQALVKDPGREEVYRKQMAIHAQMGNRPGMEESYRRCASFIRDNYGVEPSTETTVLYERLRRA